MADLSISKKNIYSIFAGNNVEFLIPDYQRPYSWGKDECETLWEDLKNFTVDADSFDSKNDEYFLGTIVTFKNEYNQYEVIDGQQRLVTLMLLLRAFYEAFGETKNKTSDKISECMWISDDNDNPDTDCFKIKSDVALDNDIHEFEKIINTGESTKKSKSLYAQNYCYFKNKIADFKTNRPNDFSIFPRRILENCILLPIETNSQFVAFRIFTTLNDRGMPLSDSDIFKSQFYKFYKTQGRQAKEDFVRRWRELEEFCNKNFHPRRGTPVDDLFRRYMYYLMALKPKRRRSNTFPDLRDFYEGGNSYEILKSDSTLKDLETLVKFWEDIAQRDEERFSNRVLKRLYVLDYSPYAMWGNIVSLYFMGNRDSQNLLDEDSFCKFLDKITAMFLMYAIAQPGVQAIRLPFFLEFENILKGSGLEFENYKQDKKFFREQFLNTIFSQSKTITRSILTWWMFQQEKQELPPPDTRLEVEHIYAKKREPLSNEENLELLGNKALLEKRINIRASDYRFADKKKYYTGYKRNGKKYDATCNVELIRLAQTHSDFTKRDILNRNEEIIDAFIAYLDANNLLR